MISTTSETGQVGGKSMFNQTCDRLREYMKENGSLGINLTGLKPRTINLFPKETWKDGSSPIIDINEEEDHHDVPKQMTIFYNGQVIVVENVSSEKASEIMQAAINLSSTVRAISRPGTITIDVGQLQARSRSLTRFFEKRKERISARAPYNLRDKSWLALSPAPAN